MGALVEIVGPSCSGKSHLLKHAIADLEGLWQEPSPETLSESILSDLFDTNQFSLISQKAVELDETGLNSVQKTVLLNYFTRISLLDEEVKLFRQDQWLIQDEGMFQNFTSELLARAAAEGELPLDLQRRHLVYLRPDNPGIVVERVLRREAEVGRRAPHHQGMSLEQLEWAAKRSIESLDKLVEKFGSLTDNVLHLKAESDLQLNVSLLRSHLLRIQK